MNVWDVVPFISATVIMLLLALAIWCVCIIADLVWSWIDEKTYLEFNLATKFVDLFTGWDGERVLCRYIDRSIGCDQKLTSMGYNKDNVYDPDLTEEHRKTLYKLFPDDFCNNVKVRVRNSALLILLGPIGLWFLLSFWLFSLTVGGAVSVMLLARQTRRLYKRVNAHIEDPDAHQKS